MRRGNGTGSVYKLQGKRRKPWVAVSSYIRDTDKVQVKVIVGYASKKTDAQMMLDAYNMGAYNLPDKITLNQVQLEWKESKTFSKASEKSYNMAWSYIDMYQNMKFAEIRTTHIQNTINEASRSGKSHATISKIKTLWNQLYKHALKNDIVNKDYSKYIDMPKSDKTEKVRFTDAEIKRLFEIEDPYANIPLILIYTGLRIGELMQLTRFNIDLDQMLITGGIKTDAGKNRIIPIHPKIQGFIRYWYNLGGNTLILNKRGESMTPDNYRESYFKPLMEQYGFRKELTPHSCRHTFASILSASGVDTLHIQKLIGHTDYALTANVYTHPEIKELQKAIKKMK